MKYLYIINDSPHGTKRSCNGLGLAGAQGKSPDDEVRVFLIGDAVLRAKAGQKIPPGFYNIEPMVSRIRGNGQVGLCGSHMDACACRSGKPSSTMGFERRWNPGLSICDREEFVTYLTKQVPPRPANMDQIVATNIAA